MDNDIDPGCRYLGECIECSEGHHERCDEEDCPCSCNLLAGDK